MLAAWELLVRWRKLIAILLAVAAVVGFGYWLYDTVDQRGYDRANKEWNAYEASVSRLAEQKMAKAVSDALAEGKRLQAEADKQDAARAAWEKDHEAAVEKHIGAVLSGVERLSVATRPARPVSGGTTSITPVVAGEPGPEERADLVPTVAAAVLRIAADSAGIVRDYNDLLDRYRMIEKACR